AQNDSSSTIIRPRWARGDSSETSVDATGSSPPSPSPAITRAARSVSNDGATADSALPIEKTTSVAVKTPRRPYRSASRPEAADRGGHAAFGIPVEHRLGAVALLTHVDRPLGRCWQVELLRAAAELAQRGLHLVDRGRPAEGESHRLSVAVPHRDAVAMRGEREAGVDEALPVPAPEALFR